MQFKCKKCGNENELSFGHILTKVRSLRFLLLCQECTEIEEWKIENREQISFDGASHYNQYNVKGNSFGLMTWIERVVKDKEKLLKIQMVDGTEANFFPIEFENDYLWCINDEYDPAVDFGMHKKGQSQIRISINKIRKLTILYIYDDYDAPEVTEPVYGYKGVGLCDGILGDNRYIYELGIPYQEEKRNPFKTDYQDVYSHFCLNMEDVLFRWGRDYISSTMRSSAGLQGFDMRLFKVKGEGHCFKTTQQGWVSNKLTIIEEVSQSEIIEYFSSKPELIDRLIHENTRLEDGENIWIRYLNTKIKPYAKLINQQEIQRMFIENCPYRKMGDCEYQLEELDMDICKRCAKGTRFTAYNENHYNYLVLRSQIFSNKFDEGCENYQSLVLKKATRELSAIKRLIDGNNV